MPNGKSPVYDGLTKEFCEYFWDDLKFYFINSLKQCKIDGSLPISQGQALIELMAKKYIGTHFLLLNVDIHRLSKSLAEK